MDQSRVKQVKTQRGFTYSYYFSPAAADKPVLFLAHGFPSGAYLWSKHVPFFESRGYGLVVPDLLGYGGTDKPTDPACYVGSGHAQDIVDIFDNEGIDRIIAVAHDWGSRVVSRLLNYFPSRVAACGFLDVGYGPPNTAYADPIKQLEAVAQMVGYDVGAYMRFFIHPDAPGLIEKNFDSFFSLLYPEQPEMWKETMCVSGGAREWIESNKTTGLPSYLTLEDLQHDRTEFLKGGMTAPLCWYKVLADKSNAEDDAKIPSTAYNINQPLLFIAFNHDPVGLPMFGDTTHAQYAKGKVTRKAVDGGHWAVLSHAHEINDILLEWIEGLEA
ncbi:alpha/beta-hydrolase [Mycena rebaudengoi]|nr:alpha/beta-hydrolase [Mycena rebaudengoi]